MTKGETLAWMIDVSKPLATRYFAGFDDNNRAMQAPNLPNHFAWTLGHCAMTMQRVAERIDGGPLPAADFAAGVEFADGSPPTRFGTEGVAFGSKPVADAGRYPVVARCVEIFEAASDRFAAAARGASDERLDAEEPWGKVTLSMAMLIVRVNSHNSMHTGQLVDLRRALGLDRVIG
ncbi:MAG: DinB family protein [Phycisphaerales bacterium JB054]